MTPEGKVKAKIKEYLDSLGEDCWHFNPMMMGYGRKGIPDIVGCYKGHMFAVEIKAPGKKHTITPWQERECRKILKACGIIIVTDNAEDVKNALQRYS